MSTRPTRAQLVWLMAFVGSMAGDPLPAHAAQSRAGSADGVAIAYDAHGAGTPRWFSSTAGRATARIGRASSSRWAVATASSRSTLRDTASRERTDRRGRSRRSERTWRRWWKSSASNA